MAIEGPLRELGIHDVFQLLDLSRKTGLLRVTSELRHNAGTVYFEGGTIIFAEIRSNPHPLGALLLRTGKISEADLERGRDMQQRQGDTRRLGEILVALGAITPRELQRLEVARLRERAGNRLPRPDGQSRVLVGPVPHGLRNEQVTWGLGERFQDGEVADPLRAQRLSQPHAVTAVAVARATQVSRFHERTTSISL